MQASVAGYHVGEPKVLGEKGLLCLRIKERYYDTKQKSSANRFISILVRDASGKLFQLFRDQPKKFVHAQGTLQTRIWKDEVDFSIFIDSYDGFKFGDCVDRQEMERVGRTDAVPTPMETNSASLDDDVPF